ncbi:hypothetical protein ERHA54_31430 [Erwinia rhapontici]|uniref:ABC transporter permease subunit n=1 Tax=Erwinia rhapontici TaxID=55212 RepID=UPI001BB57D5C|nr:hypothetical protein [Erwinia rhapontici]BCQ40540.1 hypothetical protein ERHA54_31430 [Erwinia rhapontici]
MNSLRTSALIITIATLNVFFGILLTVTGGADIFALPDWFTAGFEFVFHTDADGIPYAVNFQIIAMFLAFLLTWLLLNRSNVGRQIYAMGGNPDAAQRVGFNVYRLNMLVYGYMGRWQALRHWCRRNWCNPYRLPRWSDANWMWWRPWSLAVPV